MGADARRAVAAPPATGCTADRATAVGVLSADPAAVLVGIERTTVTAKDSAVVKNNNSSILAKTKYARVSADFMIFFLSLQTG